MWTLSWPKYLKVHQQRAGLHGASTKAREVKPLLLPDRTLQLAHLKQFLPP
jgi:hypothetical protein